MKKNFFKKNLKIIILIILILAVVLVVFVYNNFLKVGSKVVKASLGDCNFVLEVASSPKAWYKGLSGRVKLEKNEGMLFIFPDYDKKSFVMRDMNFPLDIIYLKDNKVINIEQGELPPNKRSKLIEYKSNGEVNMVIELNYNVSNDCRISNGSRLIILN